MNKVFGILFVWCVLTSSNAQALAGFQEFNFSQPKSKSKSDLSDRCEEVVSSASNLLSGKDCGNWMGAKIRQIGLSHSDGFLRLNQKLQIIFLNFDADDSIENTLVSYFKTNFKTHKKLTCYENKHDNSCLARFGDNG